MRTINYRLLKKILGGSTAGNPKLPELPRAAPIDPTLGKKQKKPDEG